MNQSLKTITIRLFQIYLLKNKLKMEDFNDVMKKNIFVRYFMKVPVLFTFGLIVVMNIAFLLIWIRNISKYISASTEIFLIAINEILFLFIMWSFWGIVLNDPGYVSKNLKLERSELFNKVKQEYGKTMLIRIF